MAGGYTGHKRRNPAWRLPGLLLLLACALPAGGGDFILSREEVLEIGRQHGEPARRRVDYWQRLIASGERTPEAVKLQRVNDFFNELGFVDDIDHWGREDYWATPLQTLVTNGGDCEDFSIAKYFTLLAMGVPPERMRLAYVKALVLDQAHMVLTYYPAAGGGPLVLDNLDPDIRPLAMRDDLEPVYSFDVEHLWLVRSGSGRDTHIGKSSRLGPWRDVVARIDDELMR